jgi:hypothetical protein
MNPASLEVEVSPVGPSYKTLADGVRELLGHPSLRSELEGKRYQVLSCEYVSDSKGAAGYSDPPNRYKALIYDYTANRTLEVEAALDSPEPTAVVECASQPLPSGEEFLAAVETLRRDPELGPAIADGSLRPYRPMPPLIESEQPDGSIERTLAVGLMPAEGSELRHEIVAVNMVREKVAHLEGGAPARSAANPRGRSVGAMRGQTGVCGLPPRPFDQLPVNRGTSGQFQVVVAQGGTELWRLLAVRPAVSSGTNGSGIELRGVDYRGKRVFDRAHVPILNVRYDNDACGPYRDWQWEEGWVQAVGTDVAPGFRRCPTPATTVLESGIDGGNFLGVALFTDGEETVLLSELEAGWYRYISEWRLHADGTIRPRFGFTGVENSCICVAHHHHAYWRFDFDIRTPENNSVQEFNDPPLVGAGNWHTLRFETRRSRNPARNRRWAVRNNVTGEGYTLTPGPEDGQADSFGIGDLWALAYRDTEIDDGQGFTTDPDLARAQLNRFVGRRTRIDNTDVVLWYAAHFIHDTNEEHEGFGHRVGPELRPLNWSAP